MLIFVLGIPGCGKSEFYRRLKKRAKEETLFEEFIKVDDFPKLWSIFMEDEKTGQWKRSRKTYDGGYKVTDQTVWDDILKELNSDLLSLMNSNSKRVLMLVEFSRPNYVHSIMNNFSDFIISQSIAVYLDVPFDICWQRNVRRHEKAVSAGTDDHLVSREEMEKTYSADDKDQLDKSLPVPVICIKNDTSDENDFKKLDDGIESVVHYIKESLGNE
ncbi:hypothetical protein ACFLTD_00800 [Elusimicrobiota bacterium]